jgi:uncharacterized membrane protein
MTDVPVQVIVAKFQEEEKAEETLKTLEEARKQGSLDFEDAAVIKKDEDGKIYYKETTDVSTGRGAAIGGVIGGVLGLIGGPAGVVILGAAGAAVGGLASHGDAGFRDERLEKLGDGLEPGTSGIVLVVAHVWIAEIEKLLTASAADVTTHELQEDMIVRMREGKGVTYIAGDIEDTDEIES